MLDRLVNEKSKKNSKKIDVVKNYIEKNNGFSVKTRFSASFGLRVDQKGQKTDFFSMNYQTTDHKQESYAKNRVLF